MQKRFTHRYKFPIQGCVYILHDPDCKYDKFKIGLSTNINQRLTSDRTMIPNIKVEAIFYTPYYDLFEKNIKIRFGDYLELPSHEWVFAKLETLIQAFKEIDEACGLNSVIEKNLWRYNNEEPPEEVVENNPVSKPKKPVRHKSPKNIPKYQNELEKRLAGILPVRILRYEYRIKTKNSPQGRRYCNGFCQTYQPITSFVKRSVHYMTICIFCDHMVDVAIVRLAEETVTLAEIRKDPSILTIGPRERICRKCNKILDQGEFPAKKRQCKKCRNAVRSKFGKNFDSIIEDEVNILRKLSNFEMVKKMDTYVKNELHKLASYLKLGRKYNDKKQDMVNKLISHFRTGIR